MWPDIAAWFQSPGGARVLQTAIVPALAILVAGVLAALISRAALRAALRRADREQAATAVAGLVEAARAAAESDSGRDRRRAARLRAEADVRVRLLPLPGAERAADWASATTDAIVDARSSGATGGDTTPLRDALVAWVGNPRRARKLFAKPAAVASQHAPEIRRSTAVPLAESPEAAPEPSAATDERPVLAPPRTSAEDTGTAEPDEAGVPAWRRTRAAERLQQEQAARSDAEQDAGTTAPVSVPHLHRADGPATADQDESSQASRHSRPVVIEEEQQAEQLQRARRTPDWLDTYDDEAEVTQNLDLRTPPPVSATAVRDRSSNTDIVPRP